MKVRFEYNYTMSFNFEYSEVNLEGKGEWEIDEELLASEYSIKSEECTIQNFIIEEFEYLTELRWDCCKFNVDDLNKLIKFIATFNEN